MDTTHTKNKFVIKTTVYEGPLDLLLELVEKRKLHISDVSLAQVTDEYISHIETLDSFPIEDTSGFLVIASTLLLIKSKALLPSISLSEDEEGDIEELELRLKIYKEVKEISKFVDEMYGLNIIFPLNPPPKTISFEPGKLNIPMLETAMLSVLSALPQKEIKPHHDIKKTVSLEEMIDRLEKRIRSAIALTFKEFSKASSQKEDKKTEKVEIVVSFLALLELVKQGIMNVRQENLFDDIHMESQNLGTPKYGNS